MSSKKIEGRESHSERRREGKPIRKRLWKAYASLRWEPRLSFSQFGEDLILEDLLRGHTGRFFIDIGAFDPVRFSNSFRFYCRGWRGVAIEPNLDLVRRYAKVRTGDQVIAAAVAPVRGQLPYFMFEEPALNTTLRSRAEELRASGLEYRETAVEGLPLREVLEERVPTGGLLGFMSVDCEGGDLEVLETNDWSRFRPLALVVEGVGEDANRLVSYCGRIGYKLVGRAGPSLIFSNAAKALP